MGRTLLGIVALIVVALVAWLLLREPRGTGAGAPVGGTPPEASVEGAVLRGTAPPGAPEAPDASVAESVAGVEPIAGVVRSRDGTALADATVYLLDKADAGPAEARTQTDEEGRFDLGLHVVKGRWVGAVAAGHLPAHLDGDRVEGLSELALELDPGPAVHVLVSDAAGGALPLETRVTVWAEHEVSETPAPGDTGSQLQRVVIPAGERETRIQVGTRGPVGVKVRYWKSGAVVEPENIRIVTPPEHVWFTIRPSCVLDVVVVDAVTREPLDRCVRYRLLRGEEVVTWGRIHDGVDRFTMADRLRPDTYELQVGARGYLRHEGTRFVLTVPGEKARAEVLLQRDPTVGSLRISIPALALVPAVRTPEGGRVGPPALFIFRRSSLHAPLPAQPDWVFDSAERPLWGRLRGDVVREGDTDYLFSDIPAGEIAFLVKEPTSKQAAFVSGVRVEAGRTVLVTVDLEPGFYVHVGRYFPREGWPRAFRVRHPIHGELPAYHHADGSSDLWQPEGVPSSPSWWIGPYPGRELEILLTDDQRRETRHVARPEDG